MDKTIDLEKTAAAEPAAAVEAKADAPKAPVPPKAGKTKEKKPLDWLKIRDYLIIATAVLVLAMVIFQAVEVNAYELFPTIQERLAGLFK